jgi:hypothetical protein
MKEGLQRKLEDKAHEIDEKEIKEEVKSTKSLIRAFLQTVKICRLYEANHPMILKFLNDLKQAFDCYFDKLDSFSLQVGQDQLLYRGNVVYESQNVKENLAFFFFRDGIREIKFFKGLEFREIADFLSIVRKSNVINRNEGDLVTLLWEKEFFHIEFKILDEFLDEDDTFIPATDEDLLKGFEYRGLKEGLVQEESAEAKTEESHVLMAGGLEQGLNLSPDQSLAQACALNPDEVEEIYRRVEQEQESKYLYVLINNLIEILLHLGENKDSYENMISYFERVIKSLLEQKEVRKAVTILRNINDTVELADLKEKQIVAIKRLLDTASSLPSIELLAKAMEESGDRDLESILQYLQLLTKQGVDPLSNLLKELRSEKWRKVVCERLAELCREEIEPLAKFLSDPDPFFVSDILYILEKIANPSTLKYLRNLANCPNSKVREQILKLITKIEKKNTDLLQKFLTDSVPEIRGKAARFLAKMDKEGAVNILAPIVLSEQFYKRNYEEKASFFMALGKTESEEGVSILKKIARQRRWLQKEKWDEMRLCAANTLRMMGVEQ